MIPCKRFYFFSFQLRPITLSLSSFHCSTHRSVRPLYTIITSNTRSLRRRRITLNRLSFRPSSSSFLHNHYHYHQSTVLASLFLFCCRQNILRREFLLKRHLKIAIIVIITLTVISHRCISRHHYAIRITSPPIFNGSLDVPMFVIIRPNGSITW